MPWIFPNVLLKVLFYVLYILIYEILAVSLHNSGRFWCWKSWSVWHRVIAFFIDIDDIDTFSAVLLPFCLHSCNALVFLVSRYCFLLLGRTGLHDWNVHSTFFHCDLRTFGASEEIVTSGKVGFVLLILLIVHCWDSRLWIGVFQFVDVPQLALRCAWTPGNFNLSIPTEGTRTTNSTQVGSQFSGHRFYRSWTAAATGPANSMPFYAIWTQKKYTMEIWYSNALTCTYIIQKTHQIGTSHPSHITCKSISKWLWLQLDWSHHSMVKRCQCPGRRWALSAPRMPTSCRKFSRRLRCAASLDRIKDVSSLLTASTWKNRPKSNT